MKRQHNDGGLQDDGIFAAWCKVFFFVRLGERSLVADSQNRQQGLNFRGVTLMIHRVMPLTSQSVACSLFTLHFQIHTWNPG